MMLSGGEGAIKLAGSAAKNAAAMLLALALLCAPALAEEERIAELHAALLQAEQIEMLSPEAVDLSADPFRYTYVLPDGVHWSVRMSENGFFALTYGDARLQPESDVQLGFARFEEPPGTTIGAVAVDEEAAAARAQAALAALGAEHLGVARIE